MTSSATRRLDAAQALLDHPDSRQNHAFSYAAFGAIRDALRWAFDSRAHEADWEAAGEPTGAEVRQLLGLARLMNAVLDPDDDEEDARLLGVAEARMATTSGELVDLDDIALELGVDLEG